MYLHLGQDKVVSMDEIVGIFDLVTLRPSQRPHATISRRPKRTAALRMSAPIFRNLL